MVIAIGLCVFILLFFKDVLSFIEDIVDLPFEMRLAFGFVVFVVLLGYANA